jgi:quercetin dioxygenase-like cupin family protein
MIEKLVKITPWPSPTLPTRTDIERVLASEGLSPYSWSNGPGDVYAVHSHTYNKVIYVVSGSITFTLPDRGEDVLLERGDRLDLPAGTRHGAQVGSTGVLCLEAHSC